MPDGVRCASMARFRDRAGAPFVRLFCCGMTAEHVEVCSSLLSTAGLVLPLNVYQILRAHIVQSSYVPGGEGRRDR